MSLLHYKHMGNGLLALFVAAGVAALAYSQLGKRVGYGNSGNVWILVGMSFVMTYLVIFIALQSFGGLN